MRRVGRLRRPGQRCALAAARRGVDPLVVSLPARSRVRGLVPALRRASEDFLRPGAISADGFVSWRERGSVRSELARPGGGPCVNDAPLTDGGLSFAPAGRRVRVSYSLFTSPRTRCPGRLLAARSGLVEIASAIVPAAAFARRRARSRPGGAPAQRSLATGGNVGRGPRRGSRSARGPACQARSRRASASDAWVTSPVTRPPRSVALTASAFASP